MRILIIDDHVLFREALVPVLRRLDNEVSVVEASTEDEAIAAMTFYDDIDLVMLDLGLPGAGGLALLDELGRCLPDTPVAIVSGERSPEIIRQAIDAGARGFIPKTIGTQGLRNALRSVLGGEVFLPLDLLSAESDTAGADTLAPTKEPTMLTRRQFEVLQMLSNGLPNKSIATGLDLSEGTVKLLA
jgi:DNA-binding NarL/FixJ family response regulator